MNKEKILLPHYRYHFDESIYDQITSQLGSNEGVVDTDILCKEEYHLTENIKNFDVIYVYSGSEPLALNWEPQNNHINILKKNNNHIKYIGNVFGEYYSSYWLIFCKHNIDKFIDSRKYNFSLSKDNLSFLCYNRRPRPHRTEFINNLKENKLFDKGTVTFQTGEVLTTAIDVDSLGDPKIWHESFLIVVTETSPPSDTFLSEKTFKPIMGLRPFVYLNHFNTYKILHSWGINLFDEWFGEWYKVEDYQERKEKVLQIVNYVSQLSSASRVKLFNRMLPTILSNRDNLIQAMKTHKVPDFNKV